MVQAATRQKSLDTNPIGARAKHASVKVATRQSLLEKDAIQYRLITANQKSRAKREEI